MRVYYDVETLMRLISSIIYFVNILLGKTKS